MKIIGQLILRPLRQDWLRTMLMVLSVALGVAVVLAVDLAGDAATGSFQSSLTSLTGKVDYQISANGGMDERVIARLTALPVSATFAPVLQRPVTVGGTLEKQDSVTLIGIDTLIDPEIAVISDYAARQFGWKAGDRIQLQGPNRAMTFRVERVITGQSVDWVAVDIAPAQQLLDAFGKLDRIDVTASAGQDAEQLRSAIASAIPGGYEIATPGARSEENQRMLRAFRSNLAILSYISLVVGAFLIYNTIAVSVVRRRVEIGILRALGVSAAGTMAVFTGEAAMLGIFGSLLGIAIGRGLAGAMVRMISDTVNSLFVTSAPGVLGVTWSSAATAISAGTLMAIFSALIPAREAAQVLPAEAMRREAREHEARLHTGRDLGFAALLAVAAIALSQPGPVSGQPLAGYAAALCAVGAAAFLAPAFVRGVIHLLGAPLARIPGAAGLIAGRSLVTSLARTSIVVTALATAIAMTISVGIMVASFRETVQVWLASELRADIYLRAAGQPAAGIYPPIAKEIPALVRGTPGIKDIDLFRAFPIQYEGVTASFGAGDSAVVRRYRSLRFLSGDADAILASLPGRERAVISEPFANKHLVRTGDVLVIPLGGRAAHLTVAGIYYDYSSDRGWVIADQSTLAKYLPDQPVTNIAVYTEPGNVVRVHYDLESKLRNFAVTVAPNETLRRNAVAVFDRTFAVTWALEGIAIIIAMLGTANSLLALVLDRRREIGLIRYLGADDGQISRMILAEAGLIGLLAAGLGLMLGAALSAELIYVIDKQSFGWTIFFHPPLGLLAGALAAVWIFTIAAGLYPARFARKLQPIETLHAE